MGLRVFVFLFALGRSLAQSPLIYDLKPWNVRGEVLVLDVSSLRYQGHHPPAPLQQPEQCGSLCFATPGCNAWTYCSGTEGCGSGCAAYSASHPRLTTYPMTAQDPGISPNKSWALPLTGFGPWGTTSFCPSFYDSTGRVVPSDKFPMAMCTLKVVPQPAKPAWWSKDPSEGWVSGVIPIPAQCYGASAGACEGCLSLRNATRTAACLRCSKSKAVMPSNLALWVGSRTPVGVGCATCYRQSYNTSRCLACINKGGACAGCPEATYATGDVDACITCASKMGKDFASSCHRCATVSGGSGAAVKCSGCLQKSKKSTCVDPNDLSYKCTPQYLVTNACSACARSAADSRACEKCVTSPPWNVQGCAGCALVSGGGQAQAECYRCAVAVPGTSCSSCASDLADNPAARTLCSSCLSSPKISSGAKNWCYACTQWYSQMPDLQAKWVECLATPHDNPGGTCSQLWNA